MSKSDARLAEELNTAGVKSDTGTAAATKSTEATDKPVRARIPAGSKPSEALAIHITDKTALYEACRLNKNDEADKATFNATAKAIDALAKKPGEKAVNLLRNRNNPDSVQVYTRRGLDQLISQGTVTSKQMVDQFATKYRPGTCSAQTNQLMSLFPALGIATRADKSTLTLNKDSLIVSQYRKAVGK